MTIFAKDPGKDELISKSMDGEEIKEIRLPVASNSIAGYVALMRATFGAGAAELTWTRRTFQAVALTSISACRESPACRGKSSDR